MPAGHYLGRAVLEARARRALRSAVSETADEVRDEASELAPRLTGALADIPAPEITEGAYSVEARIETQGAAYYAIFQHEHLDYAHPGGGQARFLESAVLWRGPELVTRLAAASRRYF